MRFSTIAAPFMALFAAVSAAPSVTVYSDDACKKEIQTITFSEIDYFQCQEFKNLASQSVKFSSAATGFSDARGWNVWDSQYCAGDRAGGLPTQLETCLSAKEFGLAAWKSVHIAPRNTKSEV